MASDDVVIIKVNLDGKEVEGEFRKITKQAKDTSKKTGKALGQGITSRVKNSLTSLRTQIVATGAAFLAAFGARKILQAAIKQEDAVQELTTSLKLAGTFSREALGSLEDFAAGIEKTTRFGDELVISQLAIARQFANTNEQAQDLVEAAVDLSAATGLTLESATRNLGKSLSGLSGELGESVKGMRDLTAEELRNGAAIKLIQDSYGGAAARNVQTFSGSLAKLSNSFGTVLENIGLVATQSPTLIAVLGKVGDFFGKTADQIKDASKDQDLFGDGIIRLIKGMLTLNQIVTPIVELVFNGFKLITSGVKLAVQGIVLGVAKIVAEVTEFAARFKLVSQESAEQARNFEEAAGLVFDNMSADAKDAKDNLLNFKNTFKFEEQLLEIEQFLVGINRVKQETKATGETAVEAQNKFVTFGMLTAEAFKKNSEDIKKATLRVGAAIRGTFVNGAVSAFSAFGAAIATGENALAAFGKAILSTFGDILIKLGTETLLVGLGMQAVPFLFGAQGFAAVAAGAIMIASGGALKALAGGGGGGGAGAGAGAGAGGGVAADTGGFEGNTVTTLQEVEEDAEPQTNVTVNVQGSVLTSDNRDLGISIAETINEAFGSDGAVIAQGGVA